VSDWPKGAPQAAGEDVVQVLMTENLARRFEKTVLAPRAYLAGPLLFSEDDLPTYIIGVEVPGHGG
jgi:hypothetical protein